ncbi:hypothetical protein IFM89_012637 [Coptis chinensis]|uniref:Uncharacterized protein n=1 Tax=Coptis chinensis TaxID=261450 RepID=A0A835IMC2_9MAGN|nr:hypothetical protein IFM89_012637 [Coptis chinensis]
MSTSETLEEKIITTGESSGSKAAEEEEGQVSGKTLEDADVLMEKGTEALKAGDYSEATDFFSRAVEIRVAHYGELASECWSAYYKYGCALLYKAQEETDPLGSVPKNDANKTECSSTSAAVDEAKQNYEEVKGASEKEPVEDDNDEDDDGNEDEDLAEPDADEDETDLDLAWKMLDVARAIVEKSPEDTMEKVDILSALGEVSLEREDIESSLSDYMNALSILHRLVEPDSRQIAELNFRICLVLEVGSRAEEAITYCHKAVSVCKARVQRLMDEVKNSTVSVATTVTNDKQDCNQTPDVSVPDSFVLGKEAEIETLNGLLGELEKKLEDLQQLALHPTSVLADVLKMLSAKSTGNGTLSALSSSRMGTNSSGTGFDSPTISTAHTKGSGDATVQDLGVVGRGVKRVSMSSSSEQSGLVKKPSLEKGKECAP